MTDEAGLAAALCSVAHRQMFVTGTRAMLATGYTTRPCQLHEQAATAALAWVDARLADPATVEAVARAMHEADPSLGVLGFGTHTNRRLATAALAVVRGLLGGTGGDLFERNLRVLKHEAETPMRGHDATCCLRAALGEDA